MKISENPKLNNTYINNLVNNIIDNIIINIKNITFIHEDDSSHPRFKFFLGLKLDEISINSRLDVNGKNFKLLLIKNLSMFLIPLEANSTIFFEFADAEFYNVLGSLSDSFYNIKANLLFGAVADDSSKVEKVNLKDNIIFAPFNLELSLYRNIDQNKNKIDIIIDNFTLEIERKQFACLLKLLKTFGKYSEFYTNCYLFRKLNYFKPSLKLLDVPNNLDARAPAYIAITEQNKIIKKKYFKEVLKNFISNVKMMISEKKRGSSVFFNIIKLLKYKKFFQENFKSFYLNPEKFVKENPNKTSFMTEIIRYVDTDFMKNWIKEIVGEIYTNQKIEESQSGFFGGVKSYFLSTAVETIKYDETKYVQNEMSIEARVTIKLSCFSISEIIKKNQNEVKNSSKFLIKNLDFFFALNPENKQQQPAAGFLSNSPKNNLLVETKHAANLAAANAHTGDNGNGNGNTADDRDKSQYINLMDSKISQNAEPSRPRITFNPPIMSCDLFITDFNFNYTTKVLDTLFLDEIIIPLNKKNENDHIFILKFCKDAYNVTELQLNLLSQAFRYNHNFIENISNFFNLEEFEKYSGLINQTTSNLLNFDYSHLQKYYFEIDFKQKKPEEVLNFSVKINHQILIIPFRKYKNSEFNDAFIFDIGELSINNFKNFINVKTALNNNKNLIFNLNESVIYLDDNLNNNNNNSPISPPGILKYY